ncbi:MAG: M48 family metallopeptidase [Nitrospirota bacterium]|nr:M48 family metallopeptidase [Nitrospirota bacterium]
MKYTPRELEGNVNISRTSLIREFFFLLGSVLTLTLVVYVALGLAVDLIVPGLSPEFEQRLGSLYGSTYTGTEETGAEKRLQQVLDSLSSVQPENKGWQYRVHLVQDKRINTLALPGGHIVVYSGLLDEVESENELAFVLAHELGHFAHRDHLRGLGRRLVLLAMVAPVFGQDSSISKFMSNSLLDVEMRFSQGQEKMADLWAVDLLNRKYGHAGGAVDFLDRIARKEKNGRLAYLFSTHPYPLNRVKALQKYIMIRGYQVKEKIPLDGSLRRKSQ